VESALAGSLTDALGVQVSELTPLTAGAHRETWSVLADDGRRFVLQRLPAAGEDGIHGGVELEARVLRAAAGAGVPVARVVAQFDNDGPLGAPALLLAHVDGESLPRRIMRDDRFAAARARLARDCGALLARLHAIGPEAVPGLAATDPIERCRDVLDRLGAAHPAFELALRRLELSRPEPRPMSVVHGDFRLGNVLISEAGISAVLDWELVHLGDPLEDLGYLCVPAWRFGGTRPVAGIGTYEELLDSYRLAGGCQVSAPELLWWQAASTVWWGVLCLVQASRHLSGETRSVELAAIGRRACEQEWDALAVLEELP
jgi:aminoglycoside phosphotransferase (APT) family kinase protein